MPGQGREWWLREQNSTLQTSTSKRIAATMDDKLPTANPPQETMEAVRTSAAGRDQPLISKPTSSTSGPATKKLQTKRASSAANSPNPSRESSPVRRENKAATGTRSATGPARARKNSSQDVSPSRPGLASSNSNPPSAAATQRVLSATSTPTLHAANSDLSIKAPVAQRPSAETPRWPISPRIRSPPPANRPPLTLNSLRRADSEVPPINVQKTSHPTEQQATTDSEPEDSLLGPGMRTPARGASGAGSTLETVQEISQPSTPAELGLDGILENSSLVSEPDSFTDNASNASNSSSRTIRPKPSINAIESGSESGGKGEIKLRSTSATPQAGLRVNGPSKSASTSVLNRGKASGEGSTRNMTVETETVSSIPQVALGGTVGGNNIGSLRAKPSAETIRPKKDKKKIPRKAPSVTGTGELPYSIKPRHHHHHTSTRRDLQSYSTATSDWARGQGPFSPPDSSFAMSPENQSILSLRRPSSTIGTMLTRVRPASSKADIFEAKVASAVDEANSSDSEETFVYESNPPDVSDRPRRFHSRTPSATSMASQVEQRNGIRSLLDGHHSVAMKKSMKFANTYNGGQEAAAGEDDGKGTGRSNSGTGRGTTHHHHLGGRWKPNGGNGHQSIFDNESPFPLAAKSKAGSNANRHSSRPTSPRVPNMRMAPNSNGRSPITNVYDLDDAADDERTPLMNSIRSNRSGRRRQVGSLRQLEHQGSGEPRSCLSRVAGCIVLTMMILVVMAGAVGFILATTQALEDVKVVGLKNVLASEQDIIFDLKVQARNPNLVVVTIDQADLVIFAKSKYAGTDSEWWRRPSSSSLLRRALRIPFSSSSSDSDDLPNSPNLEIGHISDFDSPLTFEGSPFHGETAYSLGQIRIQRPGNLTEPKGSERWGRVLQHEFDLIVRGTLKYNLPLSQKGRSVSVEGRVTVQPNAAETDPDLVHAI